MISDRPSFPSLRALLPAMLVASLGCEPAILQSPFTSQADLTNTAPVARLLVVADLQTGDSHEMYDGFTAGLTNRLTACGVQASILRPDPMELDPGRRIASAVQAFQPSAILWLGATGKHIVIESYGASAAGAIVELSVTEAGSNRVEWRAKGQVSLSSSSGRSGSNFATALVSQLRTDGVLRGCPSEDAGWPKPDPGCVIDRRIALLEAQRIADQYDRMKAYKAVPTCD